MRFWHITAIISAAVMFLTAATYCAASAPRLAARSLNDANRICRIAAFNVSKTLFHNGIANGLSYIMPLDTGVAAVTAQDVPWRACFGPEETASLEAIQTGAKLPCFWTMNQHGTIDFCEHHGLQGVSAKQCCVLTRLTPLATSSLLAHPCCRLSWPLIRSRATGVRPPDPHKLLLPRCGSVYWQVGSAAMRAAHARSDS